MNFLLDTCTISEFAAKRPNATVIDWLNSQMEERLYISSITIGELKYGVERAPVSERRNTLDRWLTVDVLNRFGDRVVPVDTSVMLRWGALRVHLDRQGMPMPPMDALIAATALAHNLILATRNTQDFIHSGVQLLNPWQDTPIGH